MNSTFHRLKFLLGTGALIFSVALPNAGAQIELPDAPRDQAKPEKEAPSKPAKKPKNKRKPQAGDIAPFLACSVCYERNYTTAIDYGADNGLQRAWCNVCRQPTFHHVPNQGAQAGSRGGGLDLPGAPRRPRAVPGEGQPASDPRKSEPGPSPPPTAAESARISRGAQFILDELERAKRIDDEVVVQAANSFIMLGESGLAAARVALASKKAPAMIAGARTLMRSGTPRDADRVIERVRGRLPTHAAAVIVDELIELDPVRATPEFLTELLEHKQAPIRKAAERALAGSRDPGLLRLLVPVLSSESSDARFRALNLIGGIEDPAVLELFLEHIDDPRAKVAQRAVRGVAESRDPRAELELLTLAFKDRWILRSSAYAILGIVEREDVSLTPVLGDNHIEPLVLGIGSTDPFVAGTCATALAGIGFRSADIEGTSWLNTTVPDRLVTIVSGREFFDDFSSLQHPALRRLKLIAGSSFGTDGPSWTAWWYKNRGIFRASRAAMTVSEGSEGKLLVRYREGGAEPAVFSVAGPILSAESGGDIQVAFGETIYLTAAEARNFVELLRREGTFEAELLPGLRGSQGPGARSLDVLIGDQSKTFSFGQNSSAPWFERAVALAMSLRERNRWQRYPNPEVHGSRYDLWLAEANWWSDDHEQVERDLRLKELVLSRLPALEPLDRDSCISELVRLYERDGVARATDFSKLVDLLRGELLLTERTESMAKLAVRAAGFEESMPPGETAMALGTELVDVLLQSFGGKAAVLASALLERCGPDAVRAAAKDPFALKRAVAAATLARSTDPVDLELLLALMRDSDRDVEVAAVLASGDHQVEVARADLLLRARMGTRVVRSAALRAVGRLGGEGVLEALVAGLTELDPEVKRSAAEGLSELADPASTSLLCSLLRQGRGAEVFEPARRGLLVLGEAAWEDLIVATSSPSPTSRREAGLILARQGVPSAAPALMRYLSEEPTDRHVAEELTILTCVDHTGEADPAGQWWLWWDSVRHNDSLAWFRAALESRDLGAPPSNAFAGEGTMEAVLSLLEVMRLEELFLVERARRELSRMLARDVGELPSRGPERDAWLTTLHEAIQSTRE